MKKHFFSHLVDIESLHPALSELDMTEHEREEVERLIDETVHHTVLDAVLSELSEEDKKIFLSHLDSDNHDLIWNFVNGKVDNIEEKIRKAAEDIKKELHTDIKETKTSR